MAEIVLRYRVGDTEFVTSCSDENIQIEETVSGDGADTAAPGGGNAAKAVENGSAAGAAPASGSRRTVTVTALRDLCLTGAATEVPRTFDKADRIMANGYQSWTETKEFHDGEHRRDLSRIPRLLENRFHFKAYGSQAFWPMRRDALQGFDYAYVRGKEPLFIGSFNHRNAYLRIRFFRGGNRIVLESDVSGRQLGAGEQFTVFDYMTAGDGEGYYAAYSPPSRKKLFGYTSWYNYYQNINEQRVLEALRNADERFDLFQIDDGFETFVGDWLDIDSKKFPNGLRPIVDRIHEKKMMAGIWLAPFVAENASWLMKEHPNWIARDRHGKFVYAGGNWTGHAALDLNRPEAVSYIRKVLRYYVGLGFDFFKLDFLYAANLKCLKGRTRAETAEFAYGILREELGSKLILGCGATLSNAFGRFDYCRIGPDVSLRFDDQPYMRLFHPERISTKVTLLNTIFRSGLDGNMFMNDPDVFLLRDDNIRMSLEQRRSLTKINALFGSLLMTSDNISTYDEEKKKILEEALKLFYEAKVLDYQRGSKMIRITYELGGKKYRQLYDPVKGILRAFGRDKNQKN